MPKTNYDVIMENMDEDTLAMLISGNSQRNECCYCSKNEEVICDRNCFEGIREWLKSQSSC